MEKIIDSIDDGHYLPDVVGGVLGLPGAGLHAYLTGDFLHPPMVFDAEMWSDGAQWSRGSRQHTIDIGTLAELRPGDHVLDVGCGVGGPARLFASHFQVSVTSVTNSSAHRATCGRLHEQWLEQGGGLKVVLADCQRHLPEGPFDAAISINMLYQVPDHRAMFRNVFERLRPGGRFVIDDWMLTPLATADDIDQLASHFQYRHFGRIDQIESDLLAVGFPTAEAIVDLGHVARGPMSTHFEDQMRRYFAPRVIADWPGDPVTAPERPAYGELMIDEFIESVNLTLRMHQACHMTYRRVLVRRPT
ncbi:hypothetical protein AWW66_22690 [Micromonospora rosaria]|uniref:Methyltransferase type 11 domain-containing protein n=1 Tax=Micromonospora rosaria TaxID=47874 RepID=A0A136PMU8_9ACTN|nr:methyltransferase domain-containing protein [Micromonospora rosaria]KXK59743.1 hypothetical protein AWW66_22690 [Micromonospora rosaria]